MQRIVWRILAAALVAAVAVVGRSSVEPGLVVASVGTPPHRVPLVIHGATTRIRHIVFIVKENRSYDNLFGLFPGGDGTSTGRTADGRAVKLTPITNVQPDLQHDHRAALTDINGGAMDGFSKLPDKDGKPDDAGVHHRPPRPLPAYWGWAKRYELMDHTFSSGDTSSFPNHLYTVAASAAGSVDGPDLGVKNWGCDGPAGLLVPVIRHGQRVKARPCFSIDSIGAQLDRRGIPWSEYGPPENAHGYGWVAYDAVKPIRESSAYARHVHPLRLAAERPAPGLPRSGHMDRATVQPQRPPRRSIAVRGRELDGRRDQPDHAHARLAPHRDRAHLGRMGRVLRPCCATAPRPFRPRRARPAAGDLAVGQAGGRPPRSTTSPRCSSSSTRTSACRS